MRFDSLDLFLACTTFEPSIIQIDMDGIFLEFLLVPGFSGTPLIVNYHAALKSQTYSLPYFTGLNITKGINATQVCLSDPTLMIDYDLNLAWYGGHRHLALQAVWPVVLDHLVRSFSPNREIHFGASGGGFAALFFAHNRDNAMAIPVNPQTDLANYWPEAVFKYLDIAWGIPRSEDLSGSLNQSPAIHDLNRLYGEGHTNTVVYLQNLQDNHLAAHLVPFLRAVRGTSDPERVFVHLHPWGEGHVPPAPDFLQIILRTMARPTWRQSLEEGKYLQLPDPNDVLHPK